MFVWRHWLTLNPELVAGESGNSDRDSACPSCLPWSGRYHQFSFCPEETDCPFWKQHLCIPAPFSALVPPQLLGNCQKKPEAQLVSSPCPCLRQSGCVWVGPSSLFCCFVSTYPGQNLGRSRIRVHAAPSPGFKDQLSPLVEWCPASLMACGWVSGPLLLGLGSSRIAYPMMLLPLP